MHRLLFVLISVIAAPVHAAVIYSTCPVPQSPNVDGSVEVVDRFRPDDFRLHVRQYSHAFPHAMAVTRWLFTREPDTHDSRLVKQSAAELGLMAEDLELLNALSNEEQQCHTSRKIVTQPIAIFPFVMRSMDANGKPVYRVRYKTCEYYVDSQRQLPIEDACTVIGRETGYTFDELQTRFNRLNENVEYGRKTLEAGVVGVGLLASVPVFRSLRFLKASSLVSLAGAVVPAGVAYYAIRENWTDELIRDVVDFRNANEVALTGDLTTSIGVQMPMQDFVPYFMRYLEPLEN